MAAGQFAVATVDGQKALQKKPLNTLFKRIRAFVGPTTLSDYTIEATCGRRPAAGSRRTSHHRADLFR